MPKNYLASGFFHFDFGLVIQNAEEEKVVEVRPYRVSELDFVETSSLLCGDYVLILQVLVFLPKKSWKKWEYIQPFLNLFHGLVLQQKVELHMLRVNEGAQVLVQMRHVQAQIFLHL